MTKPPFTLERPPPLSGERSLDDYEREPLGPEPGGASFYDERETRRAWEIFLSSGGEEHGGTLVRAAIRRSWQRSITSGVDPRGRGSSKLTTVDHLEELRVQNEDLLASAKAAFERITDILGEAATMVVITDRNGVILDVGGNRRTIEGGHDIRLEVGATWDEAAAGTNGIGTALLTGQPVHVHAGEHFCEGVKAWACVGAPIRNPLDGSVIGVIDFSGPQDIFHRHSVALAILSASQVEQAIAEKIRSERVQLLEASLGRMNGAGWMDGVIVLDRFGRIAHYNDTAASRWRALAAPSALQISGRILDLDGRPLAGCNLAERLPEELRGQSIEPLMVDGVVKGAMLFLTQRAKSASPALSVKTAAEPLVDIAKARIVGRSDVLRQAVDRAIRAARGQTAILLEGETGVGKELFAQLIHSVGKTTGKEPFVAFNCGAVSKELLGGELFGHAPGAFTGATREGRPGRFEIANGGTLSLDEIGEMPLDLQPYLLRALEERAVYRLGESKPRPVNVRLVASTNRNLKQEMEEGRFRRDLYYRIGVVRLTIPPLRQRAGDIDFLIDHFNDHFSSVYGRDLLRFDPAMLEFLQGYDWPGNVRELRNLIENLVLMSTGGAVTFDDLPSEMTEAPHLPTASPTLAPAFAPKRTIPSAPTETGGARLDETERRVIEQAIADAGGNVSVAADRLGVARSTIYRKLHQYKAQLS